MEHNIHCSHCQEDMNQADWEANHGRCLHCGKAVESEWQMLRQPINPLVRARARINIQSFLRSTPVYV